MEDDLWQEEQIKKKKRLILVLLLTLLVVTAGAAALLEPSTPATIAALETSPAPPEQAATPIAATFTITPSPPPVQGDEWTQPTLPVSGYSETPSPVVPAENGSEANSHNLTSTTEGQQESQVRPTPTQPSLTPSPSNEGKEATPELELNPTVMTPPQASTSIAEAPPSVNPVEANDNLAATPAQESETPMTTSKATPVPTEISKRINESWDILDGRYISTAEAITALLTHSSSLSETMAVVPPDGLPVTGIISRRGMNWGAVVIVVLLLGAGVIALLYPPIDQK
ncbi:MAG: hypothetical protein DPW09_41155 [Anaerolineae bacterium]|nr:hypothetical protein [Anaerolineales bacterium]MCQ3979869.1 hypothetical protein [Anaerolineae bacterium]